MQTTISEQGRAAPLTLDEVRHEVELLLQTAPAGAPLDARTRALVEVAVLATPTTLDVAGTARAMGYAVSVGCTPAELQELLVLVSGVGMHTLIATASVLAELDGRGAGKIPDLGSEGARLAEQVLDEREMRIASVAPDFWPNLLLLSPETTVRAIADYRRAPWVGAGLAPLERELIGVAVDSLPTHRFLPTLRVHVRRALELGAGREDVSEVLAIAAATPLHPGVR